MMKHELKPLYINNMQGYTSPETYILDIISEGCLAASLEHPDEGELIPW